MRSLNSFKSSTHHANIVVSMRIVCAIPRIISNISTVVLNIVIILLCFCLYSLSSFMLSVRSSKKDVAIIISMCIVSEIPPIIMSNIITVVFNRNLNIFIMLVCFWIIPYSSFSKSTDRLLCIQQRSMSCQMRILSAVVSHCFWCTALWFAVCANHNCELCHIPCIRLMSALTCIEFLMVLSGCLLLPNLIF